MNDRIYLAYLLALIWGVVWALVIQYTDIGRWLAARRTWITVVVGVGVTGAILLLVIPWEQWLLCVGVFAASAVGIVARSVINEWRDES
jgi:MFS-type transporter involved in bile tolerance (Atg22 family)